MIKQFQGLAILAILALSTMVFAGDPPIFSVSLNEKGGAIVLGDGKTTSVVESLSISVHDARFNEATSVTAKFMWPDGTQAPDGSFRTIRPFNCNKLAIGGKTVWCANVEEMRSLILDTSQNLSCFFEATMGDGTKKFLQIGANTFSANIAFVHVDDSLNVRIGVRGARPDGTHALDFMPKPAGAKK